MSFVFIKVTSGELTSEHSDEIDLEEYLNFCAKHPLGEKSEGEEEGDDGQKRPSKKQRKDDSDDGEIITSKDIKKKK